MRCGGGGSGRNRCGYNFTAEHSVDVLAEISGSDNPLSF